MQSKRLLRALRLLLSGAGCLAASISPATADRASLTLEQSVIGQTNVLRTPDHEKGDGTYEVRPRLRFERPAGDLQYQVEYSPTYDYYFSTDGINGFDQYGLGNLSYSPWPTGTVSAHTDLAYYRSIRSDTVTGPSGTDEIIPNVTGRVFRALTDAAYEHKLTPTTSAKSTFGFASYAYSTSSNADSIGASAELDVTNEVTRTLSAGVFGFASHRRFDELEPQPESNNTILHTGPIVRFTPTRTLTFEGQAGPAWIFTDRDAPDPSVVARYRTVSIGGEINAAVFQGCGTFADQPLLLQCPLAPTTSAGDFFSNQFATLGHPNAQSVDDEDLDGFGHLLVRQQEEWGFGSLEYFRGEEGSSGSGATSIRDSVTGTVQLEAGDTWSLRLRGNWNQRETRERFDRTEVVAGPSPVSAGGGVFFAEAEGLVVVHRSRQKTTQYWADARLRRQITTALSADLGVRYLYQDRTGSFSNADDFEDWRGVFTIRYELPSLDY
jgi:hypothetical protein